MSIQIFVFYLKLTFNPLQDGHWSSIFIFLYFKFSFFSSQWPCPDPFRLCSKALVQTKKTLIWANRNSKISNKVHVPDLKFLSIQSLVLLWIFLLFLSIVIMFSSVLILFLSGLDYSVLTSPIIFLTVLITLFLSVLTLFSIFLPLF